MKILVDSTRTSQEVYKLTKNKVYLDKDWVIAKDLEEFCTLLDSTKPEIISLNHDLKNTKTGYLEITPDIIGTLKTWSIVNEVPFIEILVHEQNETKRRNLRNILEHYNTVE